VELRPHSITLPRVLVAEGNAQLRLGIRLTLEREGFDVAGESGDAASAIALALHLEPDLCLLDAELPGGGVLAARAIAARAPSVRIVILAHARNDDDVSRALAAGACGYLSKGAPPRALASALHAALADAVLVPSRVVQNALADRGFRRRRRDPDALTAREWEVADLLREGLSTAEIAQRLFISEITVRRHVSSILRKLHVPNRAAAIRVVESA